MKTGYTNDRQCLSLDCSCADAENDVNVSELGTSSFELSCTTAWLSGGEEYLWTSQSLCWSQVWCSCRHRLYLVRPQEEQIGLNPPFHASLLCSLTLLWAKDVKGKEKKSWRCLITLFLWNQENKNFLFNSDYSTIVYFCFLMCYATYKVLKILAFLLGTTKEDSGKSPWMDMHLPWPIASAEISATHAAVVECLSCFTFNP